MKLTRTVLLIAIFAFILFVKFHSTTTAPASTPTLSSETQPSSVDGVPPKALDVLQIIRTTGQAPEGYVGGRIFENREGRLPSGGDYREFDVDPHHGQRNAERLIVDWKTKHAWYTGDHYRTFTPLP